ncbi:SRPBCC domain-containing protein [Streptomyces sp. NPDC052023]|uniref:SRPBCC domain-containing protein n=1 Tax=Streptomyces sp. NPDC052023 TaxID=3365681 RepID=UPI0037CCD362
MEHEVFVPVPSARLGAALADPARVARAVPGLQQEAGAEPVAGRLKVRVGSHSITYRGTVRVTAQDDGSYAVEGDATEARGTGEVKLALTLRLRDTDGGTTLTVQGGATADGRITELPAETVHSAVTRLLNRTAENLASDAGQEAPAGERQQDDAGDAASAGERQREDVPRAPDGQAPAEESPSVFDTEVPPPSLDRSADEPAPAGDDAQESAEPAAAQAFTGDDEPPAEAAHARRTMIGRSAEEVDHAPPRGRYAPVPAPQAAAQHPTLRWAAPAAALVVAGAIVLGRALRRRH